MPKLATLDVPGIRIARVRAAAGAPSSPRPRLPSGEHVSDFSWFFKSILADLDACYWLVDPADGFRDVNDDSPDAQHIVGLLYPDESAPPPPGAAAAPFLHHPRLITVLAPYVRDDWNSLHGFERLPDDPDRVAALREANERGREFLMLVDVVLENWDAAFWQLYTHNDALRERVRADLQHDPHVRVEQAPPLEIEP